MDVTIPGAFDPEKNTTYELGLKSEFLDRRLRSDFAVYYIDWTDIVIPQTVESINGQPLQLPVAFQVNGGDATIKGAEFSIDAVVTDNLSANIGVSYVDAEYGDARVDSFTLFPSFAPDGQIKGNTILRSSEWQGTAGAGYQAPLMNDIDWYLRGDAAYRGKQYADPTNQSVIPDSTTVNAHLGLTKDTWSIEIYALNLFDNDEPVDAYRDVYFTNTTPDGVTSGGRFFPWRYTVTYPRRVQYGLTWRMKF
ncbi:MAG: TonB-dependent receptor [Gammaproteobacteria bacterium]